MTVPTIHSNGTGREQLIEGYSAAYDAIQGAIDVLKRTAPNGRDYYPQGPDAIAAAVDEHMARMKRLADVQDELESLMMSIDKQ